MQNMRSLKKYMASFKQNIANFRKASGFNEFYSNDEFRNLERGVQLLHRNYSGIEENQRKLKNYLNQLDLENKIKETTQRERQYVHNTRKHAASDNIAWENLTKEIAKVKAKNEHLIKLIKDFENNLPDITKRLPEEEQFEELMTIDLENPPLDALEKKPNFVKYMVFICLLGIWSGLTYKQSVQFASEGRVSFRRKRIMFVEERNRLNDANPVIFPETDPHMRDVISGPIAQELIGHLVGFLDQMPGRFNDFSTVAQPQYPLKNLETYYGTHAFADGANIGRSYTDFEDATPIKNLKYTCNDCKRYVQFSIAKPIRFSTINNFIETVMKQELFASITFGFPFNDLYKEDKYENGTREDK